MAVVTDVDYSAWIGLNTAIGNLSRIPSSGLTHSQKIARSDMIFWVHVTLNHGVRCDDANASFRACQKAFASNEAYRQKVDNVLRCLRAVLPDIAERVRVFRNAKRVDISREIVKFEIVMHEFRSWWKSQSERNRSKTTLTGGSRLSSSAIYFSGTWSAKGAIKLGTDVLEAIEEVIAIYRSLRHNDVFFRYKLAKVSAGIEIWASGMVFEAGKYRILRNAWITLERAFEALLAAE